MRIEWKNPTVELRVVCVFFNQSGWTQYWHFLSAMSFTWVSRRRRQSRWGLRQGMREREKLKTCKHHNHRSCKYEWHTKTRRQICASCVSFSIIAVGRNISIFLSAMSSTWVSRRRRQSWWVLRQGIQELLKFKCANSTIPYHVNTSITAACARQSMPSTQNWLFLSATSLTQVIKTSDTSIKVCENHEKNANNTLILRVLGSAVFAYFLIKSTFGKCQGLLLFRGRRPDLIAGYHRQHRQTRPPRPASHAMAAEMLEGSKTVT